MKHIDEVLYLTYKIIVAFERLTKKFIMEIFNFHKTENKNSSIHSSNSVASPLSTVSFSGLTSLEARYYDDAKFVKVFHHVASKGPFPSDNDVMFSTNEGRFSVMKYVNEMLRYNGQYEMLIDCPKSLSGTVKPGIVWWRQDKFPSLDMENEEVGKKAKGFYLDPRSTLNQSDDGFIFTGLGKSIDGISLFDGTSGNNWWFAIGNSQTEKGIPCHAYVPEMSLWVRVPGKRKEAHIITSTKTVLMLFFHYININ